MADNIRVAVRVRPFSAKERANGCECVLAMTGRCLTVQSKPNKTYTYDHVYWSHDESSKHYASQDDVFNDIGRAILSNGLSGYNGCVFAYGQTGSGKTYSVFGDEVAKGIIPRAIDELFKEKQKLELDRTRRMRVWTSFIEIYNDNIYDLLEVEDSQTSPKSSQKKSDRLQIRDHPKLGVYVPGLNVVPCETVEDVRRLVAFGRKRRAIASTAMNDHSSRSHAAFTLKVSVLSKRSSMNSTSTMNTELHARLNFVDLAGAERQSKTMSEGKVLYEGRAINKGLSSLALVIMNLSEKQTSNGGSKDISGIPFRVSKLTWFLKESLAVNSKTHMLANLSPACTELPQTVSTLRFASSVKVLKTAAMQNIQTQHELVASLREELKVLRAQLAGTKEPDRRARKSMIVVEREELMEELAKDEDYERQLDQSRAMQEARDEVLKDVSADGIQTAFGVDALTPYLLNMSTCTEIAGRLIYYIPIGEDRTVGGSKQNSIYLNGPGVPDQLCIIQNPDNVSLTITRISDEGRVIVNRTLLGAGESRTLLDGSRLCLGLSLRLRVCLPASEAFAEGNETSLLLNEADEDEEINSFVMGTSDNINNWFNRLPPDERKGVEKSVTRALHMCDEATEISAACNKNDVRFEAQVTSGKPACLMIAVFAKDDEYPLCFWTSSQMSERLDRMRDMYAVLNRTGTITCDPLDDPWVEAAPSVIWERIRDLEVRLEDECMQNQIYETRLIHANVLNVSRMALTGGHQNDLLLRLFFGAWFQTMPLPKRRRRKSVFSVSPQAISPRKSPRFSSDVVQVDRFSLPSRRPSMRQPSTSPERDGTVTQRKTRQVSIAQGRGSIKYPGIDVEEGGFKFGLNLEVDGEDSVHTAKVVSGDMSAIDSVHTAKVVSGIDMMVDTFESCLAADPLGGDANGTATTDYGSAICQRSPLEQATVAENFVDTMQRQSSEKMPISPRWLANIAWTSGTSGVSRGRGRGNSPTGMAKVPQNLPGEATPESIVDGTSGVSRGRGRGISPTGLAKVPVNLQNLPGEATPVPTVAESIMDTMTGQSFETCVPAKTRISTDPVSPRWLARRPVRATAESGTSGVSRGRGQGVSPTRLAKVPVNVQNLPGETSPVPSVVLSSPRVASSMNHRSRNNVKPRVCPVNTRFTEVGRVEEDVAVPAAESPGCASTSSLAMEDDSSATTVFSHYGGIIKTIFPTDPYLPEWPLSKYHLPEWPLPKYPITSDTSTPQPPTPGSPILMTRDPRLTDQQISSRSRSPPRPRAPIPVVVSPVFRSRMVPVTAPPEFERGRSYLVSNGSLTGTFSPNVPRRQIRTFSPETCVVGIAGAGQARATSPQICTTIQTSRSSLRIDGRVESPRTIASPVVGSPATVTTVLPPQAKQVSYFGESYQRLTCPHIGNRTAERSPGVLVVARPENGFAPTILPAANPRQWESMREATAPCTGFFDPMVRNKHRLNREVTSPVFSMR